MHNSPVLYLNLPIGGLHGWGICGKHLALEMARLGAVTLLTAHIDPRYSPNELEMHRLGQLMPKTADLAELSKHPLLQAMTGADLLPINPAFKGRRTVGYTFFEDSHLRADAVEGAKRHFDRIAAGSTWCAQVLREHGWADAGVVLQGIDPAVFFPQAATARLFPGQFVVFSGGKFEFRKGQDLVIRAFKALHDRHRDTVLITAWHNPWNQSFNTMAGSPHIRFALRSSNQIEAINGILADNGVDPGACVQLAPRPNAFMGEMYRQSDVGLFPNRCEGGTNLVLMEYMACGKPVIASDSTGHRDIVNAGNAMLIACPRLNQIAGADGRVMADWPEPDLEQTIELLEQAYQRRERLGALAARGAADLAKLTWAKAAEEFYKLLMIVMVVLSLVPLLGGCSRPPSDLSAEDRRRLVMTSTSPVVASSAVPQPRLRELLNYLAERGIGRRDVAVFELSDWLMYRKRMEENDPYRPRYEAATFEWDGTRVALRIGPTTEPWQVPTPAEKDLVVKSKSSGSPREDSVTILLEGQEWAVGYTLASPTEQRLGKLTELVEGWAKEKRDAGRR